MKRYMPGFVPVQFRKVGSILLVIGIIGLAFELIDFLASSFDSPQFILYLSLGLILIALYLRFVVPKE